MLLDEPVTVPRLAVAKAWEWETIGLPHPVLGVVDVWIEDDVAARAEELIRQALAEPGFFDLRKGRVVGGFRDLMLAIANAEAECYAFSSDRDGHDRAVLAVPTGRSAVLVTVDGDLLTLERISASRLVRAVVDGLPDCPPADIDEFTVPKSEYSSNGASDSYSLDTSSDYTAPDAAEQLRTLMASRRFAGHQLYVATRAGGVRRSSVPLTAVDTIDYGRVLTFLRAGEGGSMDISCGPGSAGYISATLENTLEALRN
jgi:hypothetical protein